MNKFYFCLWLVSLIFGLLCLGIALGENKPREAMDNALWSLGSSVFLLMYILKLRA